MRLLPLKNLKEQDLKVGMQFCKNHSVEAIGKIITIMGISSDSYGRTMVSFIHHKMGLLERTANGFIGLLRMDGYSYVDESGQSNVSQAPTFAKPCEHLNVLEQKYVTSYVYRTCKDCGKALN